jgi:hypothetical protein
VSLRVLVDGEPMAEDLARAFWARFSAWMEEHKGDLGGFAREEGLTSVQPEMHPGGPVLIASRSAPQGSYGPASARRGSARPDPSAAPQNAKKLRAATSWKETPSKKQAPSRGETPKKRPR